MDDAESPSTPDSDLHSELQFLRAEVAELRAREEVRSSRRGLLRLAGAAAVAGGAAALTGSQPAAATVGTMSFGSVNDAGSDQTELRSTATATLITKSTTGVCFKAISSAGGTGVDVLVSAPTSTSSGVLVTLTDDLGHAVVAGGGQAQIWLVPAPSGPSVSTDHSTGEIAYDSSTLALWMCVSGGNPGGWRKLGGFFTAGSLHTITPARVYDSRAATPDSNTRLSTGAHRLVSIKDQRNSVGTVTSANVVPTGATAVAYNVTAIGTAGAGFLAVNPGGVTTVSAASVNWASADMVVGNASVVGVNASRQVTVVCGGGAGTSAHFTIDVVGYYL